MEKHVCKFSGDFCEGERFPDVDIIAFGCYPLWMDCLEMRIWKSGKSHHASCSVSCSELMLLFPATVCVADSNLPDYKFPPQTVIDNLTPVHGPNLTWETRTELIQYFKDVKGMLDDGTPLAEIPPFTRDKVLICGQLFPAGQYPTQDIIYRYTPKPMNGRESYHVWTAQLATYLRDLKATLDSGGDVYDLTLDWPAIRKGDDWPGERHE
jgi:hypothetical protein